MVVVVEKEENNIKVVVVVKWLCYSRSCVEINIEYGVDVGSMWGRCGGGKIKIKNELKKDFLRPH